MENTFYATPVNNRAEAIRWFSMAERMLKKREWLACRSCAIRARETDMRLARVVDEIVVIADTLHAGEGRDWYAILGVTPSQGRNMELVSNRYCNLVYMLNPQRNRFPFADQAFSMVSDAAWHILFDPMRKSLYDRELAGLCLQPPNPRVNELNFRLYGRAQPPPLHAQVPLVINDPRKESCSTSAGTAPVVNKEHLYGLQYRSNACNESLNDDAEERRRDSSKLSKQGSTFWTVCPYCFYVYEYFDTFVNRAMICQTCRRTFHALEIESPPQAVDGQEAYYACWGSLPFGVSIEAWNNRNTGGVGVNQVGNNVKEGVCGVTSSSRVNVDDKYKIIVEILDSSDEEDDGDGPRGKKLCVGEGGKTNVVTSSNGVAQANLVGQVADQPTDRFMPDFGSDLDMEVFNEFEEPGVGTSQGSGEDDAMDGQALFEGLDEFLNTLPVASEDKAN